MDKLFGKTPSAKEQVRSAERSTRKIQREVARDSTELTRLQKDLEAQIKKAAKDGNRDLCGVLAKQLVQVRKQQTRTVALNAKVGAVATNTKLAYANQQLAQSIGETGKVLATVNQSMDPVKTAKMARDFEQAMTEAGIKEEVLDDALASILDDSGAESEEDQIVQEVLDEIGIDVSGKLAKAPAAPTAVRTAAAASTEDEDDPILKRLQQLRST